MWWVIGFFVVAWLVEILNPGSSQKSNNRGETGNAFKNNQSTRPKSSTLNVNHPKKLHRPNIEAFEKLLADRNELKNTVSNDHGVASDPSHDKSEDIIDFAKLFDDLEVDNQRWGISDAHVSDVVQENTLSSNAFQSPLHKESFSAANSLAAAFESHKIYSLWHMVHKDNIFSIMNNGILSHSDAHKLLYFPPKDISNHNVQFWRERVEPIHHRRIHDYAPTYINIRNPMLYVRKELRNEMCLIEISINVIDEETIFTDGNAASKATNFYSKINDVNNLPWDVLHSDYWNEFQDGKRKRCAEVLLYPKIDPAYIKSVHCYSEQLKNELVLHGYNVVTSPKMFF